MRLYKLLFLLLCIACRSDGGASGGAKSIEQLKAEVEAKERALESSVAVGTKVPDLPLKDLAGATVSLSAFNGKVVLLNFWATWCVPCMEEMPSLQRLHDKLKAKGFVVVAVSVDDAQSGDAVRKFVKDNQITMPVLLDPEGTLPFALGVTGYPESFFIGPDGLLVSVVDSETAEPTVRFVGERAWDSKFLFERIEELVKSLVPAAKKR